jgi:hypothetical protein
MDQGFVLCTVVGSFVVYLQDVLELFSPGRDEQYACTHALEV